MTTLIAGILRLDGTSADTDLVRRMLDQMKPISGEAHHAITAQGPFAAGVLHMDAADGSIMREGDLSLAADIRLYDTPGDPVDRLATAIRQHGPNAAKALHGDFAYASWDGAKLNLARDPFGVRPLQYVHRPGAYIAFASLPGAMLQTGLASRNLDAEALAPYPSTACAMAEHTFFQDIKSVLPSHCLTVSASGTLRSHRYWRLPLGSLMQADADRDEIAAELRRLMTQAVRRRLPEDGPAAGHLSGGLDSASIAALAAEIIGPKRTFHAYCLAEDRTDPDLTIMDELPYAQAVADICANIELKGISTPDQITKMEALDPDLFLSLHPQEPEEQIVRDAAAKGAKILFSGWGGDEVVTWRGHSNVAELFWTGQWRALATALRTRAQKSNSSPMAIFRKAVLSESLPGPLRDLIRSRHGPSKPGWVCDLERMLAPDKRKSFNAVPDREYGADSRVQRRGGLEHWSLPSKLEAFAQRGARHGITYAFPMLDRDLLEFAVRIPAVLLVEDGLGRAMFRRAMTPVLPDKVRLKATKLAPYPAETLRQSQMKPRLIAELQRMSDNPLVCEFIDIDAVIAYLNAIPQPDAVRAWMNETAEAGDQVEQTQVYHIVLLYLAWYLDRHAERCE